MKTQKPEEILFADDGVIPNSHLPALLYRQVLGTPVDSKNLEERLATNNWSNSWRYGIYSYHHYHSNTHEVLAVLSGYAYLQLGGNNGRKYVVNEGDLLILPAGVGHKCSYATSNFLVFGAYPDGREPDLRKANRADRQGADENIRNVPVPTADPLFGALDGLVKIWKKDLPD